MSGIRTAGNVTISINAVAVECDVTQATLSAEGERIDTTTLCDTSASSITGFTTWGLELTGLVDVALDGLFGANVGNGTLYTVAYAITDTTASQTVTYTWTASATVGGLIESYSINTNVSEAIGFNGTVALNGSPVRSVA